MSIIRKYFPVLYRAYLLVAEPRMVRIVLFAIYITFITAGMFVLSQPPEKFVVALSVHLVLLFGAFLALGGVLSAIAVLPGIWWLERVGLLALGTGMLMYLIISATVQGSPVSICVTIAFILFFSLRFMETRQFKLAPRKN